MNINVIFDQATNTLPAGFTNVVRAVARFYDTQFTDNITFNLHVGFGEVNGAPVRGLGSSIASYTQFSYAELRNALVADAKSADDMTALGNVPAVDPILITHRYVASQVQQKALGLLPNSTVVDTYIGVSNTAAFHYDLMSPNGIPSDKFDFFSVVAHEVAEVMGKNFLVGVGLPNNPYDLSDLFHYSSSGVRDLVGTIPGYFSIDSGATNLNNFNTDPTGDFGDWANTAGNDSWRAFAGAGVLNPVTETDLRFLDIIGFERAAAPAAFGKMFLHTDAGKNAYWLMHENVRAGTGADLQSNDPTWHVKALFDQDNKGPDFSDLVWQNDNGATAIWQLQGTTVVQQNNLQQVDPSWKVIKAAGDFDGNQVADVLLQNNNGTLALWELQNTPTGPQFLPGGQFNIGQNPGATWHAVGAGDFNGDGRAGILLFNDDNISAAIWEMQPGGPAIGPDGAFNEQVNLPSTGSPTWKAVAVADFAGLGTADILWRNDNGAVAIWEVTGTPDGQSIVTTVSRQFNITQTVDPSWKVVAARDFSNDGKAGILWQNDNGAIALWEHFTEGSGNQGTFIIQQNITPQANPPGVLDWHIV
jgi:hypothetical protein